jgi:DNA-binding FrmR family transcriptional regulator
MWISFASAVLLLSANALLAADDPTPAGAKKQAVAWVDQFVKEEVLFSPKDLEKLQKKVAAMSDEEAATWWKESAAKRALLDSDDWKETRNWLREFLKVQAIYSDEQIRYFQSEAFEKAVESPRELKEVMAEIAARRRALASGARQSAEQRAMFASSIDHFREEQVRAREAAAAKVPQVPSVAPPAIVRQPVAPPNEPLVTSLDVARWAVLRSVFPRW